MLVVMLKVGVAASEVVVVIEWVVTVVGMAMKCWCCKQ